MRAISAENQAALAARALVARDFIWFVARDRETLDPVTVGFWSDLENVSAFVLNPDTSFPLSRDDLLHEPKMIVRNTGMITEEIRGVARHINPAGEQKLGPLQVMM